MTTIHEPLGDTDNIDGWVRGTNKKEPYEKTCSLGFSDEFQLLLRRKDCLKNKILSRFQALIT